jgi:MiaB/RimO family radical SAM methylthiotransferase
LSSQDDSYQVAPGFVDNFQGSARHGQGVRFGELLDLVASVDKNMRVRFTSPHPKDFTDDVLEVIAKHPNICNGIHLPAQSGSNAVLQRMKRGYTREAYLGLVERARSIIGPSLELSSDFISGFCGETEEDHRQTLSLIEKVGYTQNFMFAYSERAQTRAYHRYEDDVPQEIKLRRLAEVSAVYRESAQALAEQQLGKREQVLIEGPSRRDASQMQGRTNGLRRCVVRDATPETHPPGTYCDVRIVGATMASLQGELIL